MGILKSREELLPVTCAVLSDDDRRDFFNAVRKRCGGRFERAAKACGTTVDVVNDWAGGSANIPYHSLQHLAAELKVDAPQVRELRREFQEVVHARKSKPPKVSTGARRPPAKPGGGRGERERKPRGGEPRPKKQLRPKEKPKTRPESRNTRPRADSAEKRAWWGGALLARAGRGDTEVVLTADRLIGQNFAATWANRTQEIFGVKPALSMSEDRLTQSASVPSEKLAEFMDRMDFGPGTQPGKTAGAPRWAWSNETWKKSFLRGIVDASAHFHRTPSLQLTGLSERLSQSVLKMFSAFKIETKAGEENSLVIEGRDAIRRYYEEVGVENLKLADQLRAFLGAPAPANSSGKPSGSRRRRGGRGRRGGRRRSGASPKPAA